MEQKIEIDKELAERWAMNKVPHGTTTLTISDWEMYQQIKKELERIKN